MSIFNEIDAEQKTQIADDESELKNFSMSLSTSATKRNVDVYESNEILNDKAFEISTENQVNTYIKLHKKWSFSLRISSVNVTKSTVNCGFGHIYWRNP